MGLFCFVCGVGLLSLCCIWWVLSGTVILDGEGRDGAMWRLTSGFLVSYGVLVVAL